MKVLLLIMALASSTFLVSCTHKDQDLGHKLLGLIKKYGDENIGCLVQMPGISCSTIGGNLEQLLLINSNKNFHVVEDAHTHEDGRVVFGATDRFNETKYFGINLDELEEVLSASERLRHKDRAIAIAEFILGSAENLRFGYSDHYYHQIPNGNWELYAESSQSIKDLEALGANLENETTETLGEKLVTKYGLSTDRADAVAKNIYAYNRLTSKRSLTDREKNFFSNELLGADYDLVVDSFSSGEGVDELLEQAADVNGTSPEQVGAIINELFL